MKLSCLQENLKRGLSIVNRAVAARSTLPVLSHVLLATEDGMLKLQATNLEMGITTRVSAKVEDEGSVTLPADLFTKIVNALPNVVIALTLDAKTQTVAWSCQGQKGTIKGFSANEFPIVPMLSGDSVELPADLLRSVGARVAIAAAADNTRPVLSGVFMELGEYAKFAAADGFRLAKLTVPLETAVTPQAAIIPARALIELKSVLGDDLVSVAMNENQVWFRSETIELNSRLIDGKYPDFQRIIPDNYQTRAIVKSADFAAALRLAGLYRIDPKNEAQSINYLAFSGESVQISASMAEMGDNQGVVDAMIHGPDITMCLNNNYLLPGIAACGSADLAIEMQRPDRPAVLRPVGDETYLYLVMSMTVR